ncbi:hypothetical protein NW761_005004 [Fusarium oxysporum]|nr:hypothetical protein NW758_004411 [Fusarium oxysporum]KAJ4055514.1 hypothetical protein NW753_006273 [Fusarium oxysporum]KAJ4061898.1 hypothetical protein NW763_005295 [Fusarium oxysporum]KAJ4094564.1 hypothetical protein NW761_005004 [Fusarium oxysporum]KAJ4098752.1 hypothetical protein NW756_003350 [Fusarium oxysporum]
MSRILRRMMSVLPSLQPRVRSHTCRDFSFSPFQKFSQAALAGLLEQLCFYYWFGKCPPSRQGAPHARARFDDDVGRDATLEKKRHVELISSECFCFVVTHMAVGCIHESTGR